MAAAVKKALPSVDGVYPVKSTANWAVKHRPLGTRLVLNRPLSEAVELLEDAADRMITVNPPADDPTATMLHYTVGEFFGDDAGRRIDTLINLLAAEPFIEKNPANSGDEVDYVHICLNSKSLLGKCGQTEPPPPPDPGGQRSLFPFLEGVAA